MIDLLTLLLHPRARIREHAILALADYVADQRVVRALQRQYLLDPMLRERILDVLAHGI